MLDKLKAGLKKVADRVTGAYGALEIRVPSGVVRGEPFTAGVRLTTTAALHVQTLRLRLEEFEHIDFTDYTERTDEKGAVWQQRASARGYDERCLHEVVLAKDLKLEAGQSWEGTEELAVPRDRQPTFEGRWFRHSFKLEVVAEIPWGADLEEREVFAVAGSACEAPEGATELIARESVLADVSVRPREGAEEGDWTSIAPRWVTDERRGNPPEQWGPPFVGERCKHECFAVVDGSEISLKPGK